MPPIFWILWLGGMALTTVVGTVIVRMYRDTYGWGILVSILTALLITNTVMAGRLVNMGTLPLPFGREVVFITLTGTVIWPFTSQVVDMINEVYGQRKAYVAAGLAYFGRIIFLAVALAGGELAAVWGAEQEGFWQSYFVGSTARIVGAAFVSYAVVQFLNIYVFAKFKQRTLPTENTLWKKVKGGFLRSWGGDFFADLIDSPLFYFLAFYGTMPMDQFIALNIGAFSVKWFVNQVDLPYYALFRVLLEWDRLPGRQVVKEY